MRRFSVFKRGRFYYVQFYNEKTKRYDPRKSTGETEERPAYAIACEWAKNGIPQGSGSRVQVNEIEKVSSLLNSIKADSITADDAEKIVKALENRGLVEKVIVKKSLDAAPLIDFLFRFWDIKKSEYLKENKSFGHGIGKCHQYNMTRCVRCYWKPYFQKKRIGEISRQDLKHFSMWLHDEKGLSAKTINNVMGAGTRAFRWAKDEELIKGNPAANLVTYSGGARERGVLTIHEAARLFAVKWDDFRVRLANQLAAVTGLRSGEVLALQVRDIGEDRLFIRHSWSRQDHLKGTKTNKERDIPFPFPGLRRALLDQARMNPHGVGPTSFVFWSLDKTDQPMDNKTLMRGLEKALYRLNPAENWKSRNIVFHSWRHYFASQLANHIDQRKAMSATGHTSKEIFKVYADHLSAEVFQEVKDTMRSTFTNIIKGGPNE